jgi:hypothetical protein
MDDAAMASSLISMLAEEKAAWNEDGSTAARIYFFFSFHNYSLRRWTGLLSEQETARSQQLAQELGDAFGYVTSIATLDVFGIDRESYQEKLDELADHLRALLRIIQAD